MIYFYGVLRNAPLEIQKKKKRKKISLPDCGLWFSCLRISRRQPRPGLLALSIILPMPQFPYPKVTANNSISRQAVSISQRQVFHGNTVVHSPLHTISQLFWFDCRLDPKSDKKHWFAHRLSSPISHKSLDKNKKQISKILSVIFISRFLSNTLMLPTGFQPVKFCIRHS